MNFFQIFFKQNLLFKKIIKHYKIIVNLTKKFPISSPLKLALKFQSHYSVKTCASVGGLGTDHCIEVAADANGKMIPSELERLILENKSKGNIPFFVSVTAGTTVFGAFDPIHEIADVCKKYKLWLHIDVSTTTSGYLVNHDVS